MTESKAVPMIQVLADFRRARFAEWCYSKYLGKYVALLLCEELVAGRWEPFCSRSAAKEFSTTRNTAGDQLQFVLGERPSTDEIVQ